MSDSNSNDLIPLSKLKNGKMTNWKLDDGTEVVILPNDGEYVVVQDRCPHMGGPFSEGTYSAKDGTLECPWHGYRFDLESCSLKENPNEATYACLKHAYKSFVPDSTPKYKLPVFSCAVEGDKLRIKRRTK